MHQFRLIARRHHDKAWQVCQIAHVKGACMGGSIGPHQTGPINGKPHRQSLQSHIMHDLVIAALQERRIDRDKRL